MSGRVQRPAPPLMPAEQADRLLESVVLDRVRELIDFSCLLELEQELWPALADCGIARDEVPVVSAQMIARALARIGDEHVQLATDFDDERDGPAAD